jgi:hypothetical protein
MKVWRDPKTKKTYLVASGVLDRRTTMVVVHATNDEQTIELTLTVDEWNKLPFRFFREDGRADPPTKRRHGPISLNAD